MPAVCPGETIHHRDAAASPVGHRMMTADGDIALASRVASHHFVERALEAIPQRSTDGHGVGNLNRNEVRHVMPRE